jgi:hypothetical protein
LTHHAALWPAPAGIERREWRWGRHGRCRGARKDLQRGIGDASPGKIEAGELWAVRGHGHHRTVTNGAGQVSRAGVWGVSTVTDEEILIGSHGNKADKPAHARIKIIETVSDLQLRRQRERRLF